MKNISIIVILALFLAGCGGKNIIKITVLNHSDFERKAETVEISISGITGIAGDKDLSEVIITDRKGIEIPSQLVFEGEEKPVSLLFQADVPAASSSVFYLRKGKPQEYEVRAYGRFVPERMDDYAWENDRIAFRIYGPALIAKDGPSNGLDVWIKRTDRLVIDRWYSDYLAGKNTYHDDNGEGCDCYKVGRTLGAGAMAPFVNDSLWLAINFESYKTLDNGPVRTSFRLTYPPFLVDTVIVTETRTISLDAGSHMVKIKEEYRGIDQPFTVTAGIVERTEGKIISLPEITAGIAYSLDGGEGGITYLGSLLTDSPFIGIKEKSGHLLLLTTYTPGQPLIYYTGAGWSKWGFDNETAWQNYLSRFADRINKPLEITLE